MPPIVVHGLEVQTVSPQRAVPPVRQARGPPRQYAYRYLDGADDGSEDKAGTDRSMFGAWSPAVQRPLHQGVERLTCSPTPEPTSAEVPLAWASNGGGRKLRVEGEEHRTFLRAGLRRSTI